MLWGRDKFDLRALPTPMRSEIAYAIQRRVDERRTKTRPESILRLIRALPRAGAASLLDRTPEEWTAYLGYSSERGSIERRFLLDAISYLHDLTDGVGWDAEYPRDVWLLRRLGYPGRDGQLRFDGIEAAWLRSLTKRWIRWRLSTGISVGAVRSDVRAITLFAQSFPSLQRGPQAVTRELIEAHLAHLAARYPSPKTRTRYIGAVAGLLRTARQHGWEPRLDAHVDLYREDYPRLHQRQPRALSEAVMAQLEHPDNLARFKDPRGRLLVRILMSTGLRVGDGCKLALDCVVRDVHGAPYVHYTNHKMRREAFVPIDTDLADAISRQQQAVLAELPSATFLLPRPTRNPDGREPFSTATFRGELSEWLRACDIRDELGKPVHVTPHQWRHCAPRPSNAETSCGPPSAGWPERLRIIRGCGLGSMRVHRWSFPRGNARSYSPVTLRNELSSAVMVISLIGRWVSGARRAGTCRPYRAQAVRWLGERSRG
ncbi:tyrosine-type recombinase/integrase [Pseudonocardia sp. RS010]|uniref:tyrosine-type recombinase/integrase n=1 Tax=Pseudonocardia sp. RS010 TaxID=3385979 RepID=UPI00399F1BAE